VALASGTRIGPYEIDCLIGHGGMGEVYRAKDTSLQRAVAIKVLPDEFADDRGRLDRLQREAELLAAVSHPNIATIYGLHRGDCGTALVLEFVDGETLAERIARGRLPLPEALAVAEQIAGALEAAHARGIVHRDLKPANIKISSSGQVKVLDFGLAKVSETMTERALAEFPTVAVDVTQLGHVLGTVPYMSPEQIRGGPIDRRTDVWALGCNVFEMLTAQRAFSGATTPETIEAVTRGEPAWSQLPASTPRGLRALLRRCLQKDAHRRAGDAGQIRAELQTLIRADAGAHRFRRVAVAVALSGAAVGVIGFAVYVRSAPGSESTPTGVIRRSDVFLRAEPVIAEERAHAAVRTGPSAAELIGASRDELITVLEERARRIRVWIEAMEQVGTATPPVQLPKNRDAIKVTSEERPKVLARMKQEFNQLHERHMAALRAGQLVAADALAVEIICLLAIVHDLRDTSVGEVRMPTLLSGRSAVSQFGHSQDPRGVIAQQISDELRLHDVTELYPALVTPPRIDAATLESIFRRLTLSP
jgi:tRNA A-37 threonylcarbamoyl transferase component Bud32